MIHQDPKIIPEERPRDPQRICRGQDEDLTNRKHGDRDHGRIRLWKQRHARLVVQRSLVPIPASCRVRLRYVERGGKGEDAQVITQNPKREYQHGEKVTTMTCVTAKDAGDRLVPVLCS